MYFVLKFVYKKDSDYGYVMTNYHVVDGSSDIKVLFNDGNVVGRCAAARKIVGEPNCDLAKLLPVIREAIYQTRDKLMYNIFIIFGIYHPKGDNIKKFYKEVTQ